MSKLIVSGSSNPSLAESLSQLTTIPLAAVERSQFPNQEIKIRLLQSAEEIFLVQSMSHPVNSHIIELLLLADACKRYGAKHITAIIPWLGYAKQDKVFRPGEPLSAKVIAQMLQSGPINNIITLDLHNPSITGYFDIPVTNLSALDTFTSYINSQEQKTAVVVCPDAGGLKNASLAATKLGLDLIVLNKQRNLETGEVRVLTPEVQVVDKSVYIFDDMIATGSTMVKEAEFLHQQGAAKITICATHHLYLDGVVDKLASAPIDQVIVSDSIIAPQASKATIVSIAPLIASAITA